jgi:hypothetical protein
MRLVSSLTKTLISKTLKEEFFENDMVIHNVYKGLTPYSVMRPLKHYACIFTACGKKKLRNT